jgi:hypothetical protein
MPVDVEQQLAALGKLWNETITHVETPEIVSHDTARRNGSVFGIEGLAAVPTADQPRGIYQLTEEEDTMIELETPSQTDEHRNGPRRRFLVAGLVAAAAVVAIALVAIRKDEPVSPAPADEPSATVTVPPTTTPPPALFGVPGVRLAPGTYSVDVVDEVPTTPIHVTVGDGFAIFDDFALDGDGNAMTFSRLDRVFLDACHPSDGNNPGPVTTLDGLATALSEQAGWIDVTAPSDISIDGYAGKAFQRAVPADLSGCLEARLNSGEQSVYSPGETVTSWVLDLNGTLIVVEARLYAGQPADVAAELAAMLDSIRIVPG